MLAHMLSFIRVVHTSTRHVVKCKQTPLLSCTSLSERLRELSSYVLSKFSPGWITISSLSPGGDEFGRRRLWRVTNLADNVSVLQS